MQITRDLLYTISSIAPLIHWVRPSIYLSYPAAAAIYNIQSRYHARRGLTISGSILRINRGDVGKRRDNYSHEFWPGPAQGERAGWLAGTSPPVTLLLLPPSQFAETAQVVVTRTKDPSLSLSPPGAFVTATTPVVHPKQLRVPVRPSHFPPYCTKDDRLQNTRRDSSSTTTTITI